MSSGFIALLVAVSAGVWIYTIFMKKTGSQAKPSLIAAGVIAFIIFVVAITIMGFLPD